MAPKVMVKGVGRCSLSCPILKLAVFAGKALKKDRWKKRKLVAEKDGNTFDPYEGRIAITEAAI